MILNLGVVDLPYHRAPSRRRRPTAGTVTTGDVAGFLEDRYHVMEIFYEQNQPAIAAALESGLEGALESLIMGARPNIDPFGTGLSQIEDDFRKFITLGEMDRLGYPGVPTQAAKDRASGKRRSSRFKRRRATGDKPVSFYDTGAYVNSFKAWIE